MSAVNGKKLNTLLKDACASLSCRADKMLDSFFGCVFNADIAVAVSVFLSFFFVIRVIGIAGIIAVISIISIIIISSVHTESKPKAYAL